MSFIKLIKEQWTNYPRAHENPANFAIHCLAVPLFWLGLVSVLVGFSVPDWRFLFAGFLALFGSITLQGIGHKLEAENAKPFSGPLNFIIRLTTENLAIFPAHFFSLRWLRNN